MTQSAYDMLRQVAAGSKAAPGATSLPVAALHRDPTQPRQRFDEAALAELAASIEHTGIIEPLVVTPDPEREGEWIILVGERRHRAAAKAGLETVPVIIRTEVSDVDRLVLQLTENEQRKDLTLRERAEGYMRLRRMMEHKPAGELAAMLGKKSSAFTNTLLAAKVTEGPAFEALQEDLIKDPDALRLFTGLGEDDQKKLLVNARTAAVTLSRLMLQRFKETRQKPTSATQKLSAAPPSGLPSSQPAEPSEGEPDTGNAPLPSQGAAEPASRGAERVRQTPAPKSAITVLAALTWRHWEILLTQLGIPLPEDPDDAGYTLLEFLEARAADE